MSHQHTPQETGGYGHSAESEFAQGTQAAGSQAGVGSQQTRVGGQQGQSPGSGTKESSEFQQAGQQATAGQRSQIAGQETQMAGQGPQIAGQSAQTAGQGPQIAGQETRTAGTQSQQAGWQMEAGQAQQAGQGGPGLAIDDALTGQVRLALQDSIESARVCEWCADQCIDEGQQMSRCIRLCRDVADLARSSAAFLVRNSLFGSDVARMFAEAAEECALECQQHPHEHCQECAKVLRRAARTTRELAATTGDQAGQEVTGQLPAGQQ